MSRKMYQMFANCILCEGHTKAIICDLQRKRYHLIPLSLFELFDDRRVLDIDLAQYSSEEREILDEYLGFLLENDFVFPVDEEEIDFFPNLSTEWDFPSHISNMIVDVGDEEIDWQNLLRQLVEIRCYYIQIRFFKVIGMADLERIISLLYNSPLQGMDIFLKHHDGLDGSMLENWIINKPKVKSIIIYGCSQDRQLISGRDGFGGAYTIRQHLTSHTQCGVINPSYFTVNMEMYTESLNHNTCLNRKIAVDVDGEIKNCPSMQQSYGNIKDVRLIDVTKNIEFQKVWHISKDNIAKCKDCEFRHICSDCRAFLDDPNDLHSAPLKCGYDPYTGVWEEWSTNPLKQQARKHYGIEPTKHKLKKPTV